MMQIKSFMCLISLFIHSLVWSVDSVQCLYVVFCKSYTSTSVIDLYLYFFQYVCYSHYYYLFYVSNCLLLLELHFIPYKMFFIMIMFMIMVNDVCQLIELHFHSCYCRVVDRKRSLVFYVFLTMTFVTCMCMF